MSVFELLGDQVDIVEVAGRCTDLRPSGKAHVGRCPHPDHEDKSPSFHIYPDGRFHCYGCGWHGDAVDLWAAVNGLEVGIGAALDLAREFGIELPGFDPEAQVRAEERRRLEAEYLEKAKRGHDALQQNLDVVEWWESRGFDESFRQRFLLGAYDGRAIVPFWNKGRVEGLIMRRLEGEPKYELQKKEEFVRGCRPLFIPGPVHGETFLVEGYIDALALATHGYPAIAVGGTHISERQLDELHRLPGPIYILPDADESGRKAARKWVEKLYPKAFLCPPNYEIHNNEEINSDDQAEN